MKSALYSIFLALFLISCLPTEKFSRMERQPIFGLHGQFVAKEGRGVELSKILLEAASLMKNVEGCYLYAVSLDKPHSDTILVTEIWESKHHHDNSLNAPGVRKLINTAIPVLKEDLLKTQELVVLGGLGIK